MFRKLVSNLPFNPSLLRQVSFYAKRVRQEEGVRRLGFGFMALAMFLQVFAVISPPEKSLAWSNDYIINGLRNRDDILNAWDGRTGDANVANIYGKFGLNREDIAALPYSPNVTINSCNADYWTIGRTSLSAVSKSGKIKAQYKNSEVPVNYGGGNVYLRQLKAWDIVNNCNTYKAFQGTKNGKAFWILVDCGNFTQVGQPPILTEPGIELRKTIEGGNRTLKPGDSFTFRFEYRNNKPQSIPVENAVLEDDLDLKRFDITGFEYPINPGASINSYLNGSYLKLPLGRVNYTDNYRLAARITVKIKADVPSGTNICNAAKIHTDNTAEAWSGGSTLCITVNNPCEYDTTIDQRDERCKSATVVCTITNTAVNRTIKEYTLKTVANSTNPYLTTITAYEYNFGDNSQLVKRASSEYADEVKHTYADGTYSGTVRVYFKTGKGASQKDDSTACALSVESKPDEPLTQNKTAKNLTQNLETDETIATKVKASDIIEYSLITTNSYDYDRANVNVSDYIGDVLDYAELDRAFLTSQGGKFDEETKTISWEPQTVKANADLVNNFRVKLKSKIPSTNKPGNMTTAYDCQISNQFGSGQVDLEVKCPTPKRAEYVTSSLPNTGPGTSLLMGFVATTVVAYFFARSRLLAKELELVQSNFITSGGL